MTASAISMTADFSSFEDLKDRRPDILGKINTCWGKTCYRSTKINDKYYICDSDCSFNAWRFDGFITDAQWKTIARLCIDFKADISEVIRNFTFETDSITVQDYSTVNRYFYPTSLKGWVGGIFFMIEENGRAHS